MRYRLPGTRTFQSTLPRRERRPNRTACLRQSRFQSTLPRRERRGLIFVGAMLLTFQSTLPRRERQPVSADQRPAVRDFNPRSREGSDVSNSYPVLSASHFNPRSREGSDRSICSRESAGSSISIHAPAKGATAGRLVQRPTANISIHAPAKGATYVWQRTMDAYTISIHAPAKGATKRDARMFACRWHFNPRSREGSDNAVVCARPARGDFNPRSREGSDHGRRLQGHGRAEISIHAPAKGATWKTSRKE